MQALLLLHGMTRMTWAKNSEQTHHRLQTKDLEAGVTKDQTNQVKFFRGPV